MAPTWKDFILAIPIGMIAYTGIETISNMAEEAKDEAKTIPAAIKRVRIAVFAIYFTLPAVALSALPVQQRADGEYYTLLGLPEEEGGFAGDPILGVVKQIDLGPLQAPGEIYVGLLAATILFLATNAGLIGVSRLVYSMGIHRQMPDGLRQLHPRYRTPWIGILVFSGARDPDHAAGPGDVPRQHLLVRRDAVVHDRARGGDPPAAQASRTSRAPTAGRATCGSAATTCRCSRSSAGTFTAVAFVVIVALQPRRSPPFGVGWLALGVLVYVGLPAPQGLDLTSTHKVAIPQPVVDHEAEYDSVLVPVSDGYDEHVMATAAKLAARRRRGIHVVAFVTVPHALPIDAPMPEAEAAAAVGDRAGARAGRPARLRPRRAGPRPARPGGGSSRRRWTCARRRS